MEFRCRLGTANGEIVEGVYIADSEARLRRDLEEKGLFVLSLQPRGWLSGWSGALVGDASAARNSWSSIRNWPRSSRPGCPSHSRWTFSGNASKTRPSRRFSTASTKRCRAELRCRTRSRSTEISSRPSTRRRCSRANAAAISTPSSGATSPTRSSLAPPAGGRFRL